MYIHIYFEYLDYCLLQCYQPSSGVSCQTQEPTLNLEWNHLIQEVDYSNSINHD